MYITIDIGGTQTKIGFSKDLISLNQIKKFPTPSTYNKLNSIITKNIDIDKIEAIAIGIAGPINHKKNRLITFTNISSLKNGITLNEMLSKIKCPKYLANDAELACLGEANFGKGKGYASVAYITISTGVGGALVINNQLPQTTYNPEPGHHIMEIGGREESGTGIQGTFESLCGGISFQEIYGIDPESCDDPQIWESYAEDLAIGLHNITMIWTPDVIVMGGGLSKKHNLFMDKLLSDLKKIEIGYTPEIKISELGDTNGLMGGLAMIRQNLNLSCC